jgi:hypothetical protein
MGLSASLGVTRAWFSVCEIWLVLRLFTYWVASWVSPPALRVLMRQKAQNTIYVPEYENECTASCFNIFVPILEEMLAQRQHPYLP